MEEKQKGFDWSYVHTAIGLAICAIFWIMPPIDPITEVGMRCLGTFLSMVYLWSTVGTLWPSIFGLFMLGISGVGGDGTTGFNQVFMKSIGANTVLVCMLGFIFFGAVDQSGTTSYIARFLLTRKVYAGRPYVFLAIFFFTSALVSSLIGVVVGLMMLWPIALSAMKVLKVERDEPLWRWFFVGVFLSATLGKTFFPFKAALLIPIGAFSEMTAAAGNPMSIPYGQFMLVSAIMTFLVMAVMLLFMALLRIDASKLKAMNPEYIDEQMSLPPMNFQQKTYLYALPIYIVAILVPEFLEGNPICDFLGTIGVLGVTALFIVVFLIIQWQGKPLLDFQYVAYKNMNWGIFFMIAAAVFVSGKLSDSSTGISAWMVQLLTPLLGGQPEAVFVTLLLLFALILTNFANNAAMAVVLMPVIIEFSNQLGISPMPLAICVIMMVFVAMLTPAASPQAGMMWGRRDLYSPRDILVIGFLMSIVALLLFAFVGYPLTKFLVG